MVHITFSEYSYFSFVTLISYFIQAFVTYVLILLSCQKKVNQPPFTCKYIQANQNPDFLIQIKFLDFLKTKIQDDVTEFFSIFQFLLKFFLYISKHVKKTKTLKTDAKKTAPLLLHQKKQTPSIFFSQNFYYEYYNFVKKSQLKYFH